SANWIWRAEPKSPVGNRVLPITPKDLLVAVRTVLPKLGGVKISKFSVRNWRLSRSVIFVSLVTEKSVLINPGPVMVSRPRLPGWQEPGTIGSVLPPGLVGVLLYKRGTANDAFTVGPQAGIAGVPPAGTPLNDSHTT